MPETKERSQAEVLEPREVDERPPHTLEEELARFGEHFPKMAELFGRAAKYFA